MAVPAALGSQTKSAADTVGHSPTDYTELLW